jgi:hypothetical protein
MLDIPNLAQSGWKEMRVNEEEEVELLVISETSAGLECFMLSHHFILNRFFLS